MSYPTEIEIAEAVTADFLEDKMRAVKKLILQTRIYEADGFGHGGDEWSDNMNEEEIEGDGLYSYTERLKKEMEEL